MAWIADRKTDNPKNAKTPAAQGFSGTMDGEKLTEKLTKRSPKG